MVGGEIMEGNYYACYYKSKKPKYDSFVYNKLILHHISKKIMTDFTLRSRFTIEYAKINLVDSGKREKWIFHKTESNSKGKIVYCLDVIEEDF